MFPIVLWGGPFDGQQRYHYRLDNKMYFLVAQPVSSETEVPYSTLVYKFARKTNLEGFWIYKYAGTL